MSSTIPISACHCIQTEKQTESSLSRPKVLPSNNNNKKLLRDAGAEAAVGAACSQLQSRVGVPPPQPFARGNQSHWKELVILSVS